MDNILPLSPPPPPSSSGSISPSVLLIIVILAVIFFVSGLLHLLVRYLLKPPTYRDADDVSIDATALQGQLQQLFHLHDSGVDQSFIDTLPVFPYKAITGGVNDPFDCAVCLCEFEPDSKLRLLPKCSHAFHTDCIDTWLLSHSTCPLCRTALHPSPDFYSPARCCSSPVLVLVDSAAAGDYSSSANDTTDVGLHDVEIGGAKEETEGTVEEETKVVRIKLGKFRSVEGSSSDVQAIGGDSSLDQRRCFSMGTYEYVMSENSLLRVAIKPSKKKKERPNRAMSECDCHSKREGFKGFGEECARIGSGGAKERFSISKTSLPRSKKIDADCSKQRAFSFRLPGLHNESKAKSAVGPRTTVSEFDMDDDDDDVEVGSCNNSVVSIGPQIEKTPSFPRRTLLWMIGRQNRVGSMS